jgi:hypothetical protein
MNDWKKYIFENEHKTLYETDDFSEMKNYISNFTDELTLSDMYESMNYITLHFYGYNLMIKK